MTRDRPRLLKRILGDGERGRSLGIFRQPAKRREGAASESALERARKRMMTVREKIGPGTLGTLGSQQATAGTKLFRVTFRSEQDQKAAMTVEEELSRKGVIFLIIEPLNQPREEQTRLGITDPELQTVFITADRQQDIDEFRSRLGPFSTTIEEITDTKLAPSPGPFNIDDPAIDAGIRSVIKETETREVPEGELEVEEQAKRWAANLAVGTCRSNATNQEEFATCMNTVFPKLQARRSAWLQGRREFAGLPPLPETGSTKAAQQEIPDFIRRAGPEWVQDTTEGFCRGITNGAEQPEAFKECVVRIRPTIEAARPEWERRTAELFVPAVTEAAREKKLDAFNNYVAGLARVTGAPEDVIRRGRAARGFAERLGIPEAAA